LFSVRLFGDDGSRGRLEVLRGGTWKTVCAGVLFSDWSAKYVCEMLGFGYAQLHVGLNVVKKVLFVSVFPRSGLNFLQSIEEGFHLSVLVAMFFQAHWNKDDQHVRHGQ